MQSGPDRIITMSDKSTSVIAVAIVTHSGRTTTTTARRPQPPTVGFADCIHTFTGYICSIRCHSCFTVRSKLAIKSISSITCFCNGQKIHFIYGIFSTFCSIVWIVIVHNCCVLYCSLFCRCKCRT